MGVYSSITKDCILTPYSNSNVATILLQLFFSLRIPLSVVEQKSKQKAVSDITVALPRIEIAR